MNTRTCEALMGMGACITVGILLSATWLNAVGQNHAAQLLLWPAVTLGGLTLTASGLYILASAKSDRRAR